MGTVATTIADHFQGREPKDVTLLQLVEAICDETDDDAEVVAAVRHMLRAGLVRLSGTFRDATADDFS